MYYKLTEKAIQSIKNHPTIKGALLALNSRNDTRTVKSWINQNEVNGPLTSKANVELIADKTGLKESEILCQCGNEGEPLPYSVEMAATPQISEK